MKIAILGTRGIPNYHGGFEQFAEFFSVFAHSRGYDVYVYNSHNHPFKENSFKGVKLIKCYDPEESVGTAGQFVYDLNCIRDARKRRFDVILQLGYTSSSIWGWYLPKKAIIVTNMDGLEWKRSKYSKKVQQFLRYAEKLAVKTSDFLISDSIGIQNYLSEKYNAKSEYIAYGADVFNQTDNSPLPNKGILTNKYFCLIARMEPENNIEVILDGYVDSGSSYPFYVVGNYSNTKFGNYLKSKYQSNEGVKFLGAIYDLNFLNYLRYHSMLYFHGHSVGGTNPSLLEAMASSSLIVANNNIFNKAILGEDAFFFDNEPDVSRIIGSLKEKKDHRRMIENNIDKIQNKFNWNHINQLYLDFLIQCQNEGKN